MKLKKLILIGASTGGPGQIQKIIKTLKKRGDTAFIIIQHMQKDYLLSFASQLNKNSILEVTTSKDNMEIVADMVYVLDKNYEIKERNYSLFFSEYHDKLSYSPNINLLFNSIANLKNSPKVLSVVLTGIGDDGAAGSLNLAKKGSTCISENEESSIVYGMPKATSELNPSAKRLGIDEICQEIGRF